MPHWAFDGDLPPAHQGTVPLTPREVMTPASSPSPAPLAWLELTAADTRDHPDAIADLFTRRLDGMTVAGAFPEVACRHAATTLAAWKGEATETMFGSMLVMALADLERLTGNPHERGPYLDQTQRCRTHYREAFGFDPHERLREVVEPMSGGPVIAPEEAGRAYNPGNVRWFEPGGGGLPAHVGNEFEIHSAAAGEHLRTVADTTDHLSYFVIVQAPEEGGELSVFDLLHGSAVAAPPWTDVGRDDHALDGHVALAVPPRVGDLVLFGGGWRWHRVEPVFGATARITYGGFASRSRDGHAVYFWF